MILLDTNVIMYVIGQDHPNRAASRALLDRATRGEVNVAIDAEVLQEILHRYRAIDRWRDGLRAYDLVRRVIPDVVDIDGDVLDEARKLMEQHPGLAARDAVHAAAAILVGADALCTWDQDFAVVSELKCLRPDQVV